MLMFKKESPNTSVVENELAPWTVLLVDDEPEMHSITRLALRDVEFDGRGLRFLVANSGLEARALLANEPEIALAFIDVVMETDTAGLDLVTYIRQERGDKTMRIILRTGQPGLAPERNVIRDFDINDYLHKTDATSNKLYTSTLSALRSFGDIISLQRAKNQLERHRDGLELVIEAASSLFKMHSLQQLASGLLLQLNAILSSVGNSMIVRANGITLTQTSHGYEVLARSGRFIESPDSPLAEDVLAMLDQSIRAQKSLFINQSLVGYFPTREGVVHMIFLDGVAQPDQVGMKLLDLFSKNIPIAFENLHLDREARETEAEMLARLGDVLETRSLEAGNHVRRVACLARLLAESIGLSEDECNLIYQAAPMHDVGKVAIPDAILLKPGPLDDLESQYMKRHTELGERILGRSTRPLLRTAAMIAGQHHEKYDGSGYPRGLRGEEIHIFGRIVAIVDVFDSLLHRRCYKEPWPLERVVELMLEQRAKHFDPHLVDLLLAHIESAQAILIRYPDEDADKVAATPDA